MTTDTTLTADEIEEFDALIASRDGAARSLAVALNFHANRTSLLIAEERVLWDRVKARLSLDDGGAYKLERRHGHMRVVSLSDEERDRAEARSETERFGW